MAFADTAKSSRVAHGVASFAPQLAALAERFGKWRLYHRTISELSDISPRDLAELGLSRSNLRAAAYEAVYGTR
ncbi:DUF1127 domain-containing protein [Rhodobacteraceae bacterium D3-12]|nr:DUF1127 domain-containing protein [Rhodobacteraceae bacterium D3-12]